MYNVHYSCIQYHDSFRQKIIITLLALIPLALSDLIFNELR